MKKDQYFNLEVNLLSDDNIAGMMLELGAAEALGIYVMLLLHLRTKDNYEASCKLLPLQALARRYDMDLDLIGRVLREFNLFEVDEERQTFRAPYLDKVMKNLEAKWRLNAENGKKGGRPKKAVKSAETPASKGQKPNETQEKRGEENKSITPVVNNSSNTGGKRETAAVAAAGMRIVPAEKAGGRPLQQVLPWEKLVDELAASRTYMELAGQHSGLGLLFLEHQQQVIMLFKNHIRLYGKGGELLFLEDVRRYFSNYVAAGSPTCGRLRDVLLQELKERDSGNMSRFESIAGGQRTYLGHVIPDDAPPRPDSSAVWDDVRKRWVH
ncbi:DUF7833 domain-containing protein [Bacteroides congonensis]|uniref:DUF7833 domain-containing protein n=3 Tax=Bacteroides congonensis TaxID=1871006 RepID=UPI00267699C9|nr:Lin1244/Lin1753 domain-containing protein [Bacteroides congonensis]